MEPVTMAAKKKQDDEVQVTNPTPGTEQPANNPPLQGGDGTEAGQQPTITVELDGKPLISATSAREEPKKLDKTVSGGRYIVNGRLVNCNNEPIEE
jgi:hypothetical protein